MEAIKLRFADIFSNPLNVCALVVAVALLVYFGTHITDIIHFLSNTAHEFATEYNSAYIDDDGDDEEVENDSSTSKKED